MRKIEKSGPNRKIVTRLDQLWFQLLLRWLPGVAVASSRRWLDLAGSVERVFEPVCEAHPPVPRGE